MDLTYLSIASFILTTMLYYVIPSVGKIAVSIKALSSVEEMETFKQESNVRLAIYLAVVIFTQFIINTTFVINACGGSSVSNYGSAFLLTFLPWIFIFGIMLIILIMYPGFKGAFADIIGYFFVSDKANDALSKILISDTGTNLLLSGLTNETDKSDLIRAAESIVKMMGNKAIIINQITPLNFSNMWNMMQKLMKPTVFENEELKTDLLNIAVMRDNIGEAMWYLYTGILIISYTSFKITSTTCPPDINNLIKKKTGQAKDAVVAGAQEVKNTVVKRSVPVVQNVGQKVANTGQNVANAGQNVGQNVVPKVANNIGGAPIVQGFKNESPTKSNNTVQSAPVASSLQSGIAPVYSAKSKLQQPKP